MKTVSAFPHSVRIIENTFITMRDGAQLASRLWVPEGAETNPVPAILEYIPYRKRDLTRRRDDNNHAYMAGHGYGCVRVDMRGSGDSDGVLTDEYTQQEQEDALDVIAWLAKQPWCDGNVGMMGISWGGFNSLQVAAHRPPALKAIITLCSSDDLYADNIHYMGGCLLGDNLSDATVMFAFNSLPPDPRIVGERWRDMWLERLESSGLWLESWLTHQRRDDYWRNGSLCEDYSAIECPVFALGGWADGFTNSVFRLLEHLEAPRIGMIGPWGHKYPHQGLPGPPIGFLQEALRWWDHWLKGKETGIMNEPMLRAWLQESIPPDTSHEKRPGHWIGEPAWPSPNIRIQRFPFSPYRIEAPAEKENANRQAPLESGEEEPLKMQSPLSVGQAAGKWCSYTATPDLPGDQREEDGGSLFFRSDALTKALEIVGRAMVELELSVDKPLGMVAVRLSDVAPNGAATRVTYGLLNLTHRDDDSNPEPLEPGRRYKVEVMLNGIAQRFPEGHQLRVSVSTSYWPLAWVPPKPVTLSLYPSGCALHLPVRSASPDDASLSALSEPEQAPSPEITMLEPPHHNWLLHRDLARKKAVLEIINEPGRFRIEEIDTEIHLCNCEWYSFHDGDFTSTRGETYTQRAFKRDDWNVEVYTRTVLTCSTTHFHIHAELDAYEGEYRIYSANWIRDIPRDFM